MSCRITYIANLNDYEIEVYMVGRNQNPRTKKVSYSAQNSHKTDYTIPEFNTDGALVLDGEGQPSMYVWRTEDNIYANVAWPTNETDGTLQLSTEQNEFVLSVKGTFIKVSAYDSDEVISLAQQHYSANKAEIDDLVSKLSTFVNSDSGKDFIESLKTTAKAGNTPSQQELQSAIEEIGADVSGLSATLCITAQADAGIGVCSSLGAIISTDPAQIGYYSSLGLTLGIEAGIDAGFQFGIWNGTLADNIGISKGALLTVDIEVGGGIGVHFTMDNEFAGMTVEVDAGAEAQIAYTVGYSVIVGITNVS